MDAETYITAAGEHVESARRCYDARDWVLAHYVSGLAVECMLRAYRVREDPQFDSRHDLRELHKLAKFADLIPEGRAEEASLALQIVTVQWSNSHRFRSEASLRSYLKRLKLDRGIRGDFLKQLSRSIVDSAHVLVVIGVSKWNSSKN